MSEERFDLIDQKFTAIELRFDRVDQRLDQVDRRFDGLATDMKAGFAGIRAAMDRQSEELRRHMGVLHEEALERIADTREPPGAQGIGTSADSKDQLGRRLDPLEALVPVVREHGVTLKRHDADIERLKRRRR